MARASYADTAGLEFADRFAEKIDWGSLDLSPAQRVRLRHRLAELVAYMQRPTFEDYYRLKTQGLHYRFQVSTQAMRCLTNAADGGSGFPSDQKGATKAVRAAVHSRTGQLHVPRLSAVCLDHIAAATSHTNTGWSLLKGRVAKPFTVAAEQVNPGFMYFAESGDPSGTQGDFFLLSFFAKFRDSDNVGPVFISLAWSSEDQTWALSRMLADRWLQLHTLF